MQCNCIHELHSIHLQQRPHHLLKDTVICMSLGIAVSTQ